MARKKKREELDFVKSLKDKAITSEEKGKFRKTSFWKDFKKSFDAKFDFISGRKMPKKWQLHHMDLNPKNYTHLKKSNFIPLNGETHSIVHYIYGIYRKDKDVLKRLKFILDKMAKLNNGLDVCDYKKLARRED